MAENTFKEQMDRITSQASDLTFSWVKIKMRGAAIGMCKDSPLASAALRYAVAWLNTLDTSDMPGK